MLTISSDPGDEAAALERAPRQLVRADLAVVERQNTAWLARRFDFTPPATANGPAVAEVERSLFDRMPGWRRWPALVRRAAIGRDPEAIERIKASLLFRFRQRFAPPAPMQPIKALDSEAIDETAYSLWLPRFDALTPADDVLLAHVTATRRWVPLLFVTRLDGATAEGVAAILQGLAAQRHPGWRARFLLPDSLAPGLREAMRSLSAEDGRIELREAAAGIGQVPDGHWAVLADPDVVLRPETLLLFAEAAHREQGKGLIYADHDRLDAKGERREPAFKPEFSPELSRRLPYLGACVCASAATIASMPALAGGVAEWASAAAATLAPGEVGHVARLLYHVEGAAHGAGPTLPPLPGPAATPSVDIIIPTRNMGGLLATCIDSIRRRTSYEAAQLRIVVVDNGSDEAETLALLERLRAEPKVTVLVDPLPFNFARLNNLAARQSAAEVLVFLNNDTEVNDPGWLAALAGWAAQPEIGVVGPKLLYPDGTVQHAGVVLGIGGVAGHSFVGVGGDRPAYMGLASVTREVTALTGACIAVRRTVFEQIGGFDESLEIAFNDTALCCRAVALGYRNLYLGETTVIHHESKSRGFEDTPEKMARFHRECLAARAMFKDMFDRDPYYSPHLGLERQFQPAIPRAPRPWRRYRRELETKPRVLMLSHVHAVGHGVAVVVKQHAEYLARQGWTVFVGGPWYPNEVGYEGCLRVYLEDQVEAQAFAYEADVDCVVAHTMPYFVMFKQMGGFPRRVIFDHGEPPPAWFPDREARERVDREKQFCYRLAELVLTNTATVRDEIGYDRAEVAGLGNTHLARWSPAMALRRDAARAKLGLEGKFVVLNVCRFQLAERVYKGVDAYAALKAQLAADRPDLAERVVFVLCGKGDPEDVAEMSAQGLLVQANVSDAALTDLYAAADFYVNLSKWEGFNLGIAQALAMGLGALGSDIPAHRAFPIETSDAPAVQAAIVAAAAVERDRERAAVLMGWEDKLAWLEARLLAVCAEEEVALSPAREGDRSGTA